MKLNHIDPDFTDRHEDREHAAQEVEHYQAKLAELQALLYAERNIHC